MKKTVGWALVGLGVVAVGYLGWFNYSGLKAFAHWYDAILLLIEYPWQPYFWLHTGTSLVAGALLLVFGIRMLKTNKRAKV